MQFDDIVVNKAKLDAAVHAFNENINTKIYLTIDDEKFAFVWLDQNEVETEIRNRCGQATLDLLKQADFDFSFYNWHTATVTKIGNNPTKSVTIKIDIA